MSSMNVFTRKCSSPICRICHILLTVLNAHRRAHTRQTICWIWNKQNWPASTDIYKNWLGLNETSSVAHNSGEIQTCNNGTALHITEEDANPLSVYRKDWWLVLVNLESIVVRWGWRLCKLLNHWRDSSLKNDWHSKKACSIESFLPYITHLSQSVIPNRLSSLFLTNILCNNLK